MVIIKPMFNGKLGVMRVVTGHQGFTRAFSIRVFITRNAVPTVIEILGRYASQIGDK